MSVARGILRPVKSMTAARVMKLEKAFPVHTVAQAGHKVTAIRETFGVSQTRYYMRLNALLDEPEFIELDPIPARVRRERRDAARKSRPVTSEA